MANVSDVKPKKRFVDLGDGVEREVTFSLNAMAELEDKYGSIDAAFNKVKSGSIAAVRFLLWTIMHDNDESLTERQVGTMIRLDNIGEIMETLTGALESQMPEGVSVEDDPNAETPTKVIKLPNSDW